MVRRSLYLSQLPIPPIFSDISNSSIILKFYLSCSYTMPPHHFCFWRLMILKNHIFDRHFAGFSFFVCIDSNYLTTAVVESADASSGRVSGVFGNGFITYFHGSAFFCDIFILLHRAKFCRKMILRST